GSGPLPSRRGLPLGFRLARPRRGRRPMNAEAGDRFDHLRHLRCGDEPRAFEVPGRVLMPRAPQEILVIETMSWIVPARIAGVEIDHSPWRGEFIAWMGKAADKHDRTAGGPCEPGKARGKADEQRGMAQQPGSL